MCDIGELPNGTVKRVDIDGRSFAIANCKGKIYAFTDRCPHKGAFLSEGQVHEGRAELICPWHRFRFALDGGASVTNPDLVARTWPARVEAGEIVIEI